VADYIGLYAGPTIDEWRKLFHPAVVVAFPDDDGSIRTRTLDEFVIRQKNYFATGRQILRAPGERAHRHGGASPG
jgi:hypothetical protein